MVTFAGETEDAFNLNAAVASTMKDAQVRGTQMVLRSVMGYAAASRSINSKAAFIQSTKLLVQNMYKSVAKKLEVELLYGQVGYGAIASATTTTVTIADAEWAPGIWAGAENMPINIRNAAGNTSRGNFNITAVNFDTKTLTLDADPVAAGVVATDVIYHLGAFGKEFAGIHKILSNNTTLFGIDASQYTMWRSPSYAAGGLLSFEKLNEAVAKAVEKGLDSDVVVLVNPSVWATLLTEQAALRMYDSSYKSEQMENGSKTIKFHAQNGMIEIVPSIYVKQSYAYVLCVEDFQRVGSSDITFKRPGREGEFFRELEDAAGYELRSYTDQALFCQAPARSVIITGITLS